MSNIDSKKLLCAIPYLSSVGNSIKGFYDIDKDDIVAFDGVYDADWYLAYVAKIAAVEAIVAPKTIINEMATNTDSRDKAMDELGTNLFNLGYRIKRCINAGTITASYKSFMISQLKTNIAKHSIIDFNANYKITKKLLLDNHEALAEKGFPETTTAHLTDLHDMAWAKHIENGLLEASKKNLVIDNMALLFDFSKDSRDIVNVAFACFCIAPINTDKQKIWRMNSIVKSNVPAKEKKARIRTLNATKTIIFQSSIPNTNTMQFKLLKGESVFIGKSETKTGLPKEQIKLVLNVLQSLIKSKIPGKGRYIKLINNGFIIAEIEVMIIKP